VTVAIAQKHECLCEKDTEMNKYTVNCFPTTLTSGGKLFWQFNCDLIWLTLENNKGKKKVIDEVYGFDYREGYHLIKEYEKRLLFSKGCHSSYSRCTYFLIDKKSGKKTKEFGRFICSDTDVWKLSPQKKDYDFVICRSEKLDRVIVYYVNSGKKQIITLTDKFYYESDNPFDKYYLQGDTLTLFYTNSKLEMARIDVKLYAGKYRIPGRPKY